MTNRTYPVGTAIPGPRDPYLTPYIVEPERVVAECTAKRVVMMTAAQSGKSEMLLDIAGSRLDQRPAPILYVGPNKQFLSEQFEPRVMNLLDEAPSLMEKVARGKRMTKTRKVIAGVPFRLAHAGSSSALKSDPAALALVDEYDEMLDNIKGQGDPLGLVEARGDTYPDFVAVITSTCKRGMVEPYKDEASGLMFWAKAPAEDVAESPIWSLWQQGTRHHWCWPCPNCDEYFVPRFACLRWSEGLSPMEASRECFLECPRCGGVIEDAHKTVMNERGRYVAPGQKVDAKGIVTGNAADTSIISFWVSGLASPFVSFGDRLRNYLEASEMNDDDKIQTAMNAGFGELYTLGSHDAKSWQEVSRLRQPHYMGEVPKDVIRLTAAVDVQKYGFYYSIRGWGARASSWQIESGTLQGLTNEPAIWTDLAQLIMQTWGDMPLSLVLIDSGFRPNKPDEGPVNIVYEFCRRFRRFVRPTKGYASLTDPIKRSKIKVAIPGIKLQPTLELVRLDTDYWKSRVLERLSWPEDQAGGFLLAADASDDYCKQLVSEVRKTTASGAPKWVQVSRHNHFLDCEAMNEAAGHMLNVQKIPLGSEREVTEEDVEIETVNPETVNMPSASVISSTMKKQLATPHKSGDLRSRMTSLASKVNR